VLSSRVTEEVFILQLLSKGNFERTSMQRFRTEKNKTSSLSGLNRPDRVSRAHLSGADKKIAEAGT
jgi:hypothetical protein